MAHAHRAHAHAHAQALEAALFDGQPAVRDQVGANWLARTLPGVTRTSFGDSILRGMMPMPVAPARL